MKSYVGPAMNGQLSEGIPRVWLAPGSLHRLSAGHLWVYRSEIARVEGDPPSGALVEVRDSRGQFAALGHYSPYSEIRVRALTRRREPINEQFWRERLNLAVEYRDERWPGREARRLVNSEADLLPGLILDQYADHVVLQATTAGMDILKNMWVRLIMERLDPGAIVERNDGLAARRREGLADLAGILAGTSDGRVRVRIGKALFECDLLAGHKTGFYLDQQENYERVAAFVSPGDRCLDVFCGQAGFAVHALLSGAASVLAIDSSEAYATLARRVAVAAGVTDRLAIKTANAFDVLRRLEAAGETFDLIVLDPPSFTRSRAALSEALRGYKEIHVRALRMLSPRGRLATFCCSHHIGTDMFFQTISAAAADAGVMLRRELVMGAAPDHPVLASVPETEYLKGFLFTALSARTARRHRS